MSYTQFSFGVSSLRRPASSPFVAGARATLPVSILLLALRRPACAMRPFLQSSHPVSLPRPMTKPVFRRDQSDLSCFIDNGVLRRGPADICHAPVSNSTRASKTAKRSPVASASIVITRVPVPRRVRGLPRRKVPRLSVVRAAISIRVRRRRWVVAVVRIVVAPATGRRVVLDRATRGRSVAGSVVVVLASRASVAVSVWPSFSARAVSAAAATTDAAAAAGRSTAVVVLERGHVRTATGRARAAAFPGRKVGLGLVHAVRGTRPDEAGARLTSAMHWTRFPLNSRPSSFSTAVRRSAAVSNSTKLLAGQQSRRKADGPGLTLCRWTRDRSRSRRRPGWTDAQSL